MQLLRKLVLIEQDELVKEEKSDSGLVILKSNHNLYQFGDDNQKTFDIIMKKKLNIGKVLLTGKECHFVVKSVDVIYKKNSEQYNIQYQGKGCVIVDEDDILCTKKGDTLIPHPGKIIVKISQESRDALFSKKILCDDGSIAELFTSSLPSPEDERHSQFFVSTGEVYAVGSEVAGIEVGDTSILDYLQDNDENIIVGYDGVDKLIAVIPDTFYSGKDEWVYASRLIDQDRKSRTYGRRICPHDVMVTAKGDYEYMSNIVGVVRGDKLISRDPFVFLKFEDTVVAKKTASGIIYNEKQKILEREVLAAPEGSKYKTGDLVVVDDYDIFDVFLTGSKKTSVINDVDIISPVSKIKDAISKIPPHTNFYGFEKKFF